MGISFLSRKFVHFCLVGVNVCTASHKLSSDHGGE